MNIVWSESERNFVKANASLLKDSELAAALSRLTGRHVTVEALRKVRRTLGIKKMPGRGVCELERPSPDASVGLSLSGE